MKHRKICAIIIIALSFALIAGYTVYGDEQTAGADNTDTKYRIQPLLEELALMDPAAIDNNLLRYTDMSKHWSRQFVGKLTGLGIVAGSKGKFMPDSPLQADQFIAMAIRSMGFKDITENKKYWAQPFIDLALSEKLVMPGEIKDYTKPLTREMMAQIIVRTAMKVDAAPDTKYDQYLKGKIADYPAISDNRKQAVLDAYKLGLVEGSGGKFNPKATMTRAEAATVILNVLDRTGRKPAAPGPGEIIKLVDNLGNPMEIYPGSIAEYFEIEKVMQSSLPKAKGYAPFFYSPETGAACVSAYKSYEAWQQDCIGNTIATIISSNSYDFSDINFAYRLDVWQKGPYKELFAGYIRVVLQSIFDKDANKAIELHDKYMNLTSSKPDGSGYYDVPVLNNRKTEFRGDGNGFSIMISLKGQK